MPNCSSGVRVLGLLYLYPVYAVIWLPVQAFGYRYLSAQPSCFARQQFIVKFHSCNLVKSLGSYCGLHYNLFNSG